MTEITLNDRNIVVTGAAGRLAGVVLEALDRAGASVAALVLNEKEADEVSLPAGGATFIADAGDAEQVRNAFVQIADRYGRIDALVHTVGMWGAKPFLDTTEEDWEELMRVNLTSAFLCFREAARHMRPREEGDPPGRLIAMSSVQGADRAPAQQAAYAAAKAGVVRLVEAVAAEFDPDEVTAHAIAPSLILYGAEDPATKGVPAERIAELCLYLCTEAGDALNGSMLWAYGAFNQK